MRNRLLRISAGLAALVALGLGGAAIASATQSGSTGPKPPAAATQSRSLDADAAQLENGADGAAEAAGDESGSEAPGDDGPGGHADEPGNPNADHQFDGQE